MFSARRAVMKVARAHKITICRRVPNTQTTRLLNTLSTKPLIENRPETLSTSQQIMNFFDMTPKTAKWLGVLGITTTLGIAAVWLYKREVVPFSGRKRFAFVDPTWHAKYDARSDPDIKKGLEMLDNGHKNPELLWPNDHPATKIVQRIFSKLIAESGLDHMDWDVQILSTKGRYLSPLLLHSRRLTHSHDSSTPKRYPIVMVAPNGKVVVFSEGLKTLSDEAELAAILSKGISEVAIDLPTEHYCNSLLLTGVQYACCLNIVALQISGRCWLVLPLLVLPLVLQIAIWSSICSNQKLEQETDYVSMVIMSKAGYDPRAYVKNAKKKVEINESLLKRIQEGLACELTIKFKSLTKIDTTKIVAEGLRNNIKVKEENVWKMVQTVLEIMEKSGHKFGRRVKKAPTLDLRPLAMETLPPDERGLSLNEKAMILQADRK